jgi:ribose transport system permease protein
VKRPIWPRLAIAAVLALLVAAIQLREPSFLSLENLRNVGQHLSLNALVAAGMTLVILTGGIDLSVGSIVAFAGIASALAMKGGAPVAAGVALGIAAGAAIGGLNGALIAFGGLPPFIVTLAMMVMARSVTRVVTDNMSIYDLPPGFAALGGFLDLGPLRVPAPLVLVAAVYLGVFVLLRHYPLGRAIYAIGGNEEAARLSGIRLAPVKTVVYAICGALAGLAGVVAASRLGAADPKQGQMFELAAIAAVVVGGTSLSGGRGHVAGTLLGVVVVAMLENAMNLLDINPNWQGLVQGLVILGAVLASRFGSRSSAR